MIASNSECLEIAKWATDNKNTFTLNLNGPFRQFSNLIESDKNIPQCIWDIKNRIIKEFTLENKLQEPEYKDFCSIIDPGGFIHKHKDFNQGELIHTRFNVMISKPEIGGIPFTEDGEMFVEEGEVYRTDAGLKTHWCSLVEGNKPRITLSFGFLL